MSKMASDKTGVCQITVTGRGVNVMPAERATLVLCVKSSDVETPKEASEIITTTANTLHDMIMPLFPTVESTGRAAEDAAIVHYSMTSLETSTVHPSQKKEDDRHKPLYRARVDLHVKFRDFGALNGFATKVSGMDHVSVSEITWQLTDNSKHIAHSAARKVAGENALQKAYDFAQVFCGVEPNDCPKRVIPVKIDEDSYYNHSTKPQVHYAKGLRGARTDSRELQFEPEDVSVTLNVNATFHVDV